MTKETRTAWTVAAVLAVIVIILLGVMAHSWYERRNDMATLFRDGDRLLGTQRELIHEHCNGPEGQDAPACQKALEDLSKVLTDFSKNFERIKNSSTTQEIMPE